MTNGRANPGTLAAHPTSWPRGFTMPLTVGCLVVCFVWAFWSTITGLINDWQGDPNYSVGQLVPFAALYLIWIDRSNLTKHDRSTCWWGLAIILVAQLARLYGLLFLFESAQRYALVLTIVGVVLLVCGWRIFWAARWILLFLFLMVPLPGKIHNTISGPLQNLATEGAVSALELLGIAVTNEGNVMVLNDHVSVSVVEACSGLRMLTAFIIVAAAFAYIVGRPRWQKVALIISSIPVAIACNLIRLVVTALLFMIVSGEIAKTFFHDFAGWTMMPLAIAMLAGELWIMSKLVVTEPKGKT